MSRAKSDGAPSRKLIDVLAAGPDIGPPTAVLATTFDLNPDFFETDFLPSLLGIPASEDRRWRTRVQLESELARLDSAAVLMEATRWNGRPRTLRVHVQPARARDRRVLHAKLVLVVHEDSVRLVVGSANLTKAGYRENREVAVALVATKKTRDHGALILQALDGIEARLRPWWTDSADAVVTAARATLDKLSIPSPSSLEDEWFAWGGDEMPLVRSFARTWPEGEAVRRIRIVSPFWSEESGHGPLAHLLRELAERGASTKAAEVLLITAARPDGGQAWRPALPESYATFDFASLGVRASAVAARLLVDAEDAGRDDVLVRRELHAKVLLLEGPKTSLAYVGSANFTTSGWGTGTLEGSNLEAGIILRRQGKSRAALDSLIPPLEGEPVRLEGTGRRIVKMPPEIEAQGEWPHFLHSVELRPEPANVDRLELVVTLAPQQTPPTWSVAIGVDTSPRATTAMSALEYRMPLDPDDIRALIELQAVQVRWEGSSEAGVSYPVNVSLAARERLPFGDARLLPTEDDLVAFYQGRIAFEDLFPPPPGEVEGDPSPTPIVTESVVDTSKILSYQVRAFVEALTGVSDELARNTVTERSMRLATLGPVSPVALAREIAGAAARGRSAVAAGFQLAELLGVLRAARHFPVDARLASAWASILSEAESEVGARLTELRSAHLGLADGTPFGAYVRATRVAALEET